MEINITYIEAQKQGYSLAMVCKPSHAVSMQGSSKREIKGQI